MTPEGSGKRTRRRGVQNPFWEGCPSCGFPPPSPRNLLRPKAINNLTRLNIDSEAENTEGHEITLKSNFNLVFKGIFRALPKITLENRNN